MCQQIFPYLVEGKCNIGPKETNFGLLTIQDWQI